MQLDLINLSRVQRRCMKSTWKMSFKCSIIKSWVIMSEKETDYKSKPKEIFHTCWQRSMSVSLSTAEKQEIKLLAQCLVQSRCSSISVELIKQWMKVEWISVTRLGMQKDCTFFQTVVRNVQFITWWLEMCCVFESWHLGTNDRVEKVQHLRTPDYHPIPIHIVKHYDFMVLESGSIPQFKFLQYSGGETVPGAGKAVGWVGWGLLCAV